MKRFHSLDAMRAILMLLGIYFHLAHAYAPIPTTWSINPETVSMFFAGFMFSSTYFRMHAFFLIAGFFGALLYDRKGASEMILNRIKRILLPLILMIWPIWILNSFSMEFAKYRAKGLGLIESFSNGLSIFNSLDGLFPMITMHLWFLNYLFFMSVFAFIVKYLYDSFFKDKKAAEVWFSKIIMILFNRPWPGTLLFCFSFSMLMSLQGAMKAQGAGWWEWFWFFNLDGIKSFIAFSFFYVFGWHIYYKRSLLDKLSIKKQLLMLILLHPLVWSANTYLIKFSDSPYPYMREAYKKEMDLYRPKHNVTFSIDMSQFDFDQFDRDKVEFRGVFLQGSFNDWCGECDRMEDEDGDLVYTKTIEARKGIHEFIFTINGWDAFETKKWHWISGATEDSECDAKPGHKDNPYVVEVVDQTINLDTVCWQGSCYDCSGNQVYKYQPSAEDSSKGELFYTAYIFIFNFMVPCYIMFVLSLFVKLYNVESKRLRYISDASYWVYIVHLPLTHFVPGLFHQSSMNVFLKFTTSSIIVTGICFASYHYLVRATFIGKFLNGRRYPNQ